MLFSFHTRNKKKWQRERYKDGEGGRCVVGWRRERGERRMFSDCRGGGNRRIADKHFSEEMKRCTNIVLTEYNDPTKIYQYLTLV